MESKRHKKDRENERPPTLPHGLHLPLGQEAQQSPRDGEPQRPRLAGPAAAAHGALQVEASERAYELQREHQLLSERRGHGEETEIIKKKRSEGSKLMCVYMYVYVCVCVCVHVVFQC